MSGALIEGFRNPKDHANERVYYTLEGTPELKGLKFKFVVLITPRPPDEYKRKLAAGI